MQESNELNPADRELEEALGSLAPAAMRVDAVGAAFEAGRRSARRQLNLWRSAAAAALLVGVSGWILPSGAQVAPTGQVGAPIATHDKSSILVQPLAAQSVLKLQAAVREHGLAGLPVTQLPVVGSRRPSDLL